MANIPDLTNDRIINSGPQATSGWHLMAITQADAGLSENKNEVHKLEFSCIRGDEAGAVAHENFTLSTEVGRGRYKALINAIGFKTFKGLTTQTLLGKILRVFVVTEEFVGRDGGAASAAKAQRFAPGGDLQDPPKKNMDEARTQVREEPPPPVKGFQGPDDGAF